MGVIEVSREVRLAAPAAEIWALIGPFDGLDRWHPAVLQCEPDEEDGYTVRRVKVVGNVRTVQRLLSHDDARRSYRYTITEGDLPVHDYDAVLSVREDGHDACVVTWRVTFQAAGAPDDVAREAIEGIFDGGLNGLAHRFGQPA